MSNPFGTRTHLFQEFANHLPPEVVAVVDLSALYQTGVTLASGVDPDEDRDRIPAIQGYLNDVYSIAKVILARKEAEVSGLAAVLENTIRSNAATTGSKVTDAAIKALVQGNTSRMELQGKLDLFLVFIDHLKDMRKHADDRKDLALEKAYERRSLRNDKDR